MCVSEGAMRIVVCGVCVCWQVAVHITVSEGALTIVVGVMKMGNIVPRAGIEHPISCIPVQCANQLDSMLSPICI